MLSPCPTCQSSPRFQRRGSRHGVIERLSCATCGRATPWLLAARNAEHRPELLYLWDQPATAAAKRQEEGQGQPRIALPGAGPLVPAVARTSGNPDYSAAACSRR